MKSNNNNSVRGSCQVHPTSAPSRKSRVLIYLVSTGALVIVGIEVMQGRSIETINAPGLSTSFHSPPEKNANVQGRSNTVIQKGNSLAEIRGDGNYIWQSPGEGTVPVHNAVRRQEAFPEMRPASMERKRDRERMARGAQSLLEYNEKSFDEIDALVNK